MFLHTVWVYYYSDNITVMLKIIFSLNNDIIYTREQLSTLFLLDFLTVAMLIDTFFSTAYKSFNKFCD